MRAMAAIIALAILAFAATFHFYWALGGKRGWSVSLPQRPDGRPVLDQMITWWRAGAALVALALVAMGIMVASELGWIDRIAPAAWQRRLFYAFALAAVLRCFVPNPWTGFFKTVRGTPWARYDTRYFSPLFLILGASLAVIALG